MPTDACPDTTELAAFLAGTTAGERSLLLERHLAACAQCARRAESIDHGASPLEADVSGAFEDPEAGDDALTREVIRRASVLQRPGPAEEADAPGSLGRFRIERRLGSGSFGHVFEARDSELGRPVALKVLRGSRFAEPDEVDRFLREARTSAPLKHPGIVLLYEAGRLEDGTCYLVEELVPGVTLARLLGEGPLPPREAAGVVAALADALHYAHERGVVHRDVKPSNVMVDEAGRPHLMDFGLARFEQEGPAETPGGEVLGTPAYMAPEQARGDVEAVGRLSDVYGLGAILYEAITGRAPFTGPKAVILNRVAGSRPERPRAIVPSLPRDLETICRKAMDPEPSRRYGSAAAFAEDLRRFLLRKPVLARPVGPLTRLGRWAARNPLAATFLVAVVVASVVALDQAAMLTERLVRKAALEGAELEARLLEEVNRQYTTKVVERTSGVVLATHDYAEHEAAIPLPATLMAELGAAISARSDGDEIRHYSDHPFRTRPRRGPRDAFEEQALVELRRRPGEPFYRFVDDYRGTPALRYATARVMTESCVDCHNSHELSTKRDWKAGDVRGVLEVIRPLDTEAARARRLLRGTFTVLGLVFGALVLLSLGFAVGRKRRV